MRSTDERISRILSGEEFLVLDGAMGTVIQKRSLLEPGEQPETFSLTHYDDLVSIHRTYLEAGAEVITTSTFGVNRRKLPEGASVAEVFEASIRAAREAGARYVAADIGPSGALLEPLGTFSFREAYDLFAEQVDIAARLACDFIFLETFTDLKEIKAAVLAAREHSDIPVFATMSFGEDGRTFLGTTPEVAAITLSSLGVQAVGVNCSLGPDAMIDIARRIRAFASCPVVVRPNAGLPRIEAGQTHYDVTPEDFARAMEDILDAGATIVGGCCGTDERYIRLLAEEVGRRREHPHQATPSTLADAFCATSAQRALVLPADERRVALVGERINPTGRKRIQEALVAGDWDVLIGEAVEQDQAGADILDVNVGMPGIDEPTALNDAVLNLQAVVTAPLQLDSSNPEALERAAREYAGKPLLNSVNGTEGSLASVLPIAKKYGCAVLGLTLDDQGLPKTAEERLAIARRIVEACDAIGIPRHDVIIDCLVMTAATNHGEAVEILRAVSLVKEQLGVRTLLGVSNVSFGLPQRDLVNATFLAAALGAGLDVAIVNPLSTRVQDVVATYRALINQDENAREYITRFAPANANPSVSTTEASAPANTLDEKAIRDLVLSGRAKPVAEAVRRLIVDHDPIAVVNDILMPALDDVALKYDRGEYFLPQLMASAEAVKAGFDVVRAEKSNGAFPARSETTAADKADAVDIPGPQTENAASRPNTERTVLLATVQGDIHDIGKNIVGMLLENYGFTVIDLGFDVAPETVVEEARARNVRLIGLSALMTTTVPAMERTIALVHETLPDAAVMVGGAVLTPEYAKIIGADFYGKDASQAARNATAYFDALSQSVTKPLLVSQ